LAVLYSGIITHEIAHAILHQNAEELDLPATAHEYVAYAVQLASYPGDLREALTLRTPAVSASNLFVFSNFLLLADPDRFAITAYSHFRQPENGCAFLAKVLQQKVYFPPPSD